MDPRVSVIVPCYNTAGMVADTLDSIFAQTYRDFEVIVINDGSPDTVELEKVLAPYRPDIRYIVKENGGLASARNAGIAIARGELVAFIDSDDLWVPEYLAFQVAQLDANPDADIVYPNTVYFGEGENGTRLGRPMSAPMPEVTFTRLVTEECAVVVACLARKAAVVRAGLFDEQLRRCEDFDLWLRCVKSGAHIIYHHQPLVRYRIRRGSLSADTASMTASAAKVLRKMRTAVALTGEERAVVERKIRYFEGSSLFFEGKQAFLAGDDRAAIGKLRAADELLHSGRIRLLVLLLRIAPGMARRLYRWKYRNAG